jgi:hypothetical protein
MKVRISPISLEDLKKYLRRDFRGFDTKDYELVVALNLAIYDSHKRGVKNSIGIPVIFKKSKELEERGDKVTVADILKSYVEEDHPVDFFLVPHNKDGKYEKGGNAFQIKQVRTERDKELTESVLALAGKYTEAKNWLFESCVHLAAYGHRKDVTLYEIIEPIPFIAKRGISFAQKAFKKLYPLVEAVWRYTDGKSTQYSLTYWLEALVDSNFVVAAQGMTELVTKDQKRDWRVERGTNYFCDKLLQTNLPKVLVAELYETINQMNDVDYDVTVGLNIVEALLVDNKKGPAEKLFRCMSRSLYLTLLLKNYLREKENIPKMFAFAEKFNLTIPEYEKIRFDAEIEKKPMELRGDTLAEKKTIPKFKLKGVSLEKLRRLMDKHPSSYFFEAPNRKELAGVLFNIDKERPGKVQELILSVARNGYINDTDIDNLIKMQGFFIKKKKPEIAAFIGVLCFVYARGGNGWHSLADSKYNYLLKDAFKLSKVTAKDALTAEMSYLFVKQGYYTGPTRHFIEFYALNSGMKMAMQIWSEAFAVIKFRLPIPAELDDLIEKDMPSFGYKSTRSLRTVIEELITARKGIVD